MGAPWRVMDAFPQKQVDFRMLEEVSGIVERRLKGSLG